METISNNEAFKKTLSSLPLGKQRQIGARFVGHVLDLTDGRCTHQAQHLAEKSELTPEELEMAYQAVHAVYVASHPRSDLSELDYAKQAAHLVAEACMTCVTPTFGEHRAHHLAENVAGYCCMARICANLKHDGEEADFSAAEKAMNGEMKAQFEILNAYLEENN
jgi:hypothetical protein